MTEPEAPAKLQHIRWGVAGPGRAASRFALGLEEVQAASIAAVWGRTPERAKAFCERFIVPDVFSSLDELLASDVDAIYVATHPDTHAEICVKALVAGKHVLCEKPSALNVR